MIVLNDGKSTSVLMVLLYLLEQKSTMQGPAKHSRSSCGKLFDSQHGTRTRWFFFSPTNTETLKLTQSFSPSVL